MSKPHNNNLKNSMAYPLLVSALLMAGSHRVCALPQDGAVGGGSASISSGATDMTVTQSSNRAIVNWKSFDIGANESVTFAQPSAQAVILNRVTGSQTASQIFGALNANGTVMIVNAHGVLFGAGSKINVGGLIASSSDIGDTNFMNGDYTFDKAGAVDAAIENEGSIIADKGLVAMVGPNVMNNGYIQARLGKVQLASGETFALDLYGDGLIKLQASDKLTKQLVSNKGTISADGGDVLMTTAAAENSLSSVINMDGLVQADSVGEKNGHVVLYADGGTTNVSGTINARGTVAGEAGGSVKVRGNDVTVASGAVIDASGQAGGGSVTLAAAKGAATVEGGASVTGGADGVSVTASTNIKVGDNASITTTGGNVSLQAAQAVAIGKASVTSAGGKIDVSGTGNVSSAGGVSLNGTTLNAGGGDITVTGSTFGATYGIDARKATLTTSGTGSIVLNGTGGQNGFGSATAENYGIALVNTTVSATDSGNVTINGTGGANANASDVENFGVLIAASNVTSESGKIEISGFGGNDTAFVGTSNTGLSIGAGSTIHSTTGAVTLTGVGGENKPVLGGNTYGLSFYGPAVIGGDGESGKITFIADTINDSACSECGTFRIQTTDNVTFKPYTSGTSIGVVGADGVLQVSYDLLNAVTAGSITVGDLDGKAGDITANGYQWRSDVSFLSKSGTILVDGKQDLGEHTFLADTQQGDISLGQWGQIVSEASGTAITLAASGGNFTNGFGADALAVNEGSRWLIYSTNPADDKMNGLTSDFHRYSCTFGGSCPDFSAEKGNGNLYSFTPFLTVTPDGKTITYGDAVPTGYGYSLTGYLLGDDFAAAMITGTPSFSTTYALGSHVGAYDIDVASVAGMASGMGYGIAGVNLEGGLKVIPADLHVSADNKTMVYGAASIPALTYSVRSGDLKNADTASSVLTGALDVPSYSSSLPGPFTIEDGTLGLVAGNKDYNYYFDTGLLTVTIPKGPAKQAVQQGDFHPTALRSLGYNGVLLAMSTLPRGALGNLSPAAGGSSSGVMLTPAQLAQMAPAAGGNGSMTPEQLAQMSPSAGGGTLPLLTCGEEAPCQINQ